LHKNPSAAVTAGQGEEVQQYGHYSLLADLGEARGKPRACESQLQLLEEYLAATRAKLVQKLNGAANRA
jgi:hypothetical protein